MSVADLKKIVADMPDGALVVAAGSCERLEDPPQDRGFNAPALCAAKLHFS